LKLQEDCSVADLKMSDYGIKPEEFETMAKNAKDTMVFLFTYDRRKLSIEDCVAIYRASYK
jgi:alcohol dehydrogenase